MGKKQHSKDQLYITQTEWKKDWGGKKEGGHLPYKVMDARVPCGHRARLHVCDPLAGAAIRLLLHLVPAL